MTARARRKPAIRYIVGVALTAREMRQLHAAVRRRKHALSTVIRALTLTYYGVAIAKRPSTGPGAVGMRKWVAPMIIDAPIRGMKGRR